jgi:hypothetical protein
MLLGPSQITDHTRTAQTDGYLSSVPAFIARLAFSSDPLFLHLLDCQHLAGYSPSPPEIDVAEWFLALSPNQSTITTGCTVLLLCTW